jgi:RNA polymerase sigma factor (sigma-70 family)
MPAVRADAAAENSDRELVDQVRGGDDEAFRALVERHQAALLRLAGRFLDRREDAEDVVQETFIAAHGQMDRFRGEASVATWLGRIAIYRAMRLSRRRKRAPEQEYEPAMQSAEEGDPAEALAVREAVGRLPEKLRLPVVLRFWEGLSGKEIAATLGWPQNTVWTRLYRGLERVKRELQGDEAA